VVQAGPSTGGDVAAFMLGGDGDLELHAADNLALTRDGAPLAGFGRFGKAAPGLVEALSPSVWPPGLRAKPSATVKDEVLREAGARPWDRDAIDARIVRQVAEGTGRIIDSEAEVGGYPVYPETRRPFVAADWDLKDMSPRRPSGTP
jgi:hypothetical protein